MTRLRAILITCALLTFAGAAGGSPMECRVSEGLVARSARVEPRIVSPGPLNKTTSLMFAMMRPPEVDIPVTERERLQNEVRQAIFMRDTARFAALMPTDPKELVSVLVGADALDHAIHSGAPAIVDMVIELDPRAMVRRDRQRNSHALAAVAWQWSQSRSASDGPTIVGMGPPPTRDQYLKLVEMLLRNGADPLLDEPPYGYAIASISGAEPCPQVTDAVERLLALHASIDTGPHGSKSALATAAARANVAVANVLLANRTPSQDSLDQALAYTPLQDDNPLVGVLVDRGARLDPPDTPAVPFAYRRKMALEVANRYVESGDRTTMHLLVDHGLDPKNDGTRGSTILVAVVDDPDLLARLLERGANPNGKSRTGETPLLTALSKPALVRRAADDMRPLVEVDHRLDPLIRERSTVVLLEHGADPNVADAQGNSALMLTHEDTRLTIDSLLQHGASIESIRVKKVGDLPVGPVTWALSNRNDNLAAALIDHVAALPDEDCGAVYYAAYTGAMDALAALLRTHPVTRFTSDRGYSSALVAAAAAGQLASVIMLLDRGRTDVNERSQIRTSVELALVGFAPLPVPVVSGGQTALMAAARSDRTDVMAALIARGAQLNAIDAGGQTAMDQAVSENAKRMLKAAGANDRDPTQMRRMPQ